MTTPLELGEAEITKLKSKLDELEARRQVLVDEQSEIHTENRTASALLDAPFSETKHRLGIYGKDYNEWRSQTNAAKTRRGQRIKAISEALQKLNPQIKEARARITAAENRLQRTLAALESGIDQNPFSLLEASANLFRCLLLKKISLGREGKVVSVIKNYLTEQAEKDESAFEVGKVLEPEIDSCIEAVTAMLDEFSDMAHTVKEENACRSAEKCLRVMKRAKKQAQYRL